MITKFENMVDDTLDSDFVLQLLNDAKNEIEALRDWEQLKKEQSYTITAGSSYTTTQALPARFINDIRVIESDDTEYRKISFEDRYAKVNLTDAYFLDMANSKIGFTGQNLPAATVYLYYTQGSDDLATGDTWAFPARFHAVIPYFMAKLFYAADAGEKARSWDDRWDVYMRSCLASMEMWDDRLKIKNRSTRVPTNRENSLNLPAAFSR